MRPLDLLCVVGGLVGLILSFACWHLHRRLDEALDDALFLQQRTETLQCCVDALNRRLDNIRIDWEDNRLLVNNSQQRLDIAYRHLTASSTRLDSLRVDLETHRAAYESHRHETCGRVTQPPIHKESP